MSKRLQVLMGSAALFMLSWVALLNLPEHKAITASSLTFTIAESRVGNGHTRRRVRFDETVSQAESSDRRSDVS